MSNKENKVPFRLKKIITEQFAVIPKSFTEENEIAINHKLSFGISVDTYSVMVNLIVNYECNSNPFIIIEVNCIFDVNEEVFNTWVTEESVSVPEGLAKHFAVLTTGTTRGVLHAKLEKSDFSDYILPTININDVVEEDVVFPLNEEE
jgi:hypothetical protein